MLAKVRKEYRITIAASNAGRGGVCIYRLVNVISFHNLRGYQHLSKVTHGMFC
jgi:hypothetical protein